MWGCMRGKMMLVRNSICAISDSELLLGLAHAVHHSFSSSPCMQKQCMFRTLHVPFLMMCCIARPGTCDGSLLPIISLHAEAVHACRTLVWSTGVGAAACAPAHLPVSLADVARLGQEARALARVQARLHADAALERLLHARREAARQVRHEGERLGGQHGLVLARDGAAERDAAQRVGARHGCRACLDAAQYACQHVWGQAGMLSAPCQALQRMLLAMPCCMILLG